MTTETMRLIDAIGRALITSDEELAFRAQGKGDFDMIDVASDIKSFATGMLLVERDPNSWVDVEFVLNGAGSEIADATQDVKRINFNGNIKKWTILSIDGTTGSIVIDVWKDTYANYPPSDADSITASAVPAVSTAIKAESSTLTGWTTSVAAGEVLVANVDSCTSIKLAKLILSIEPRLSSVMW